MNPDGPSGSPFPSYKSALNALLTQTSTPSSADSVVEMSGFGCPVPGLIAVVTQVTSSIVPAEGRPSTMYGNSNSNRILARIGVVPVDPSVIVEELPEPTSTAQRLGVSQEIW